MSSQAIARYEIVREIARSNDIVYEAYDPLARRQVAIKVLGLTDPQTGEPLAPLVVEERKQRFNREAASSARLNHPNIMAVYDVGEEAGTPYIVFELLAGVSLRGAILSDHIEATRIPSILTGILAGLAHAHANGIIHRDIKPANVQLLLSGDVKLIDFGIAKNIQDLTLTRIGMALGTPAYMSPEQIRGADVDERSDLWGAGCIAYLLYVGKPAFKGANPDEVFAQVLGTEPEIPPQLPAQIRQFLSRSLHKDPTQRFQSAEEMMQAVAELPEIREIPVAVPVEPAPKAVAPTRPRFRRPRRSSREYAINGAIAVAFMAVVLMIAWPTQAAKPALPVPPPRVTSAVARTISAPTVEATPVSSASAVRPRNRKRYASPTRPAPRRHSTVTKVAPRPTAPRALPKRVVSKGPEVNEVPLHRPSGGSEGFVGTPPPESSEDRS